MARFIGILTLILLAIAPIVTYNIIHTSDARDGKIHLQYMAWGNPEQQDTDTAVLKEFEEKHPNIKIDFIVAPGNDYPPKVQIMMASGIAPDVFKFDLFYLPKYFPHDVFMPLNDFDDKDNDFDFNDFYPATREELTYKGKIMGLNTLFGGRIIYYNKNLFKEAGLPDPYEQYTRGEWTFEAMAKAARTLSKFDKQGTQTQLGLNVDIMDLWWLIWSSGGEIIDKNHNIYINEKEAIGAMEFYADLLKDRAVLWRAQDSSGYFSLENGRTAMYLDSQGMSPRLRNQIKNKFDWDICPVPKGSAGLVSLMKGNGLIMSSRTKHPAEAWEFMKFLNSPETEMKYCGPALRRAVPTRIIQENAPPGRHELSKYLSDTWEKDPNNPKAPEPPAIPPPPHNTKTFLNIHTTARQLPVTEKWQDWQPDFNFWFDRLNRQVITPKEFAAGLEGDLKKVFGEPTGKRLFEPGAKKSPATAGAAQ